MELKSEHPQGDGQLHKPSSFIYILAPGGCGSEPQRWACSVHYILPVKWGILLLFPWHFSSAGKGRVVARTWLFTFTSWCVHIITWLEELRLWEKNQMFIFPEIKLWDLAALLLGVPGAGGEGTPRFLLMQISVLKMSDTTSNSSFLPRTPSNPLSHYAEERVAWSHCTGSPWSSLGRQICGRANIHRARYRGETGLVDFFISSDILLMGWKARCFSDTSGFWCLS